MAFRVTHRQTPGMEPAIHAIGAPNALFSFVRSAVFHGAPPAFAHAAAILGMYLFMPVRQVLSSLAGISQELFIDHFGLACRSHGGYKCGDAVDHQAKLLLAGAEGFLSALVIFDVCEHAIPADN